MSDVDLSVRAPEISFATLYDVSRRLKDFIPNLGEIEFYTDEEWAEMMELASSPMDQIWHRLLLVRKLSWQRKALALAQAPYESAKQERGIAITMKRLGVQSSESFSLAAIFPEFSGKRSSGKAPPSSQFLEHPIAFQSEETAAFFWQLLPESPDHPEDEEARRLKHHLCRREILLTVVSKRNQMLRGEVQGLEAKNEWLTILRHHLNELRGK